MERIKNSQIPYILNLLKNKNLSLISIEDTNGLSRGKVKVKCSNTGSSEDLNRNVCLYQEGKGEVSKPGGFKSTSPSTVTFDIKDINTSEDTDIYIYTDNNLNIYSIEYVPD